MNKVQNRGIYWLASYPKSGNTWFRIVLANLLKESDEPVDLNDIHTGMIASCRSWMEDALGVDTGDLSHDELDVLRPQVYRWYSEQIDSPKYHKIHDACSVENKTPLVPAEGCLGALYFIRNPLDVAISFANHSACTIDEAIQMMGNPQFALCNSKRRQVSQLRQWLLSWSMHVNSWAQAKDIHRLVIRYEDMKATPHETFSKALHFLQIHPSETDLERALANAHIDKLQQQEEESGFCEKPFNVTRFFRKGIVGDWENTLTEAQIAQIIADHGSVMQTYGYLDDKGQPVIS
jgi:aryl sulfotransferase